MTPRERLDSALIVVGGLLCAAGICCAAIGVIHELATGRTP